MFMSLMSRDKAFYRSFGLLIFGLMLEQVAVLSVNLIDNVMIGNYSETSLAAITAINQIQFIFQYLMTGVTNGMLSLGSQYHGNRMDGHLKKIIAAATRLALLFAAILFLLSCFVPDTLMRLFVGDSPEVVAEGVRYLGIIKFTYPLFALTSILLSCMRTVETVSISVYVSCVALVINFCLNYTLIFGHFGAPELGVAGAAVGTLVARIVELVIVTVYVFRMDRKLKLKLPDFKTTDPSLTRDYLKISAPIMFIHGLFALNTAVQNGILGHLDTSIMAAYSISSVLFQLLKVAAIGASTAATILIGQSVGRNDPMEKIREYTRTLQILFASLGIVLGVLYYLLSFPLLSFYTLEPETYDLARSFLLVQSVVIVGMSYQMPTMGGLMRGGGNARYQLVVDLIGIWAIALPLSFLGAFLWGWSPLAVVICMNSDQLFKCIPAFIGCNRYRWVRRLVKD